MNSPQGRIKITIVVVFHREEEFLAKFFHYKYSKLIWAFVFIILDCGELFFCTSILRKLTAKVALGYPLPIFARRSVAGGSSPRAPGNQNNESTRLRLSHLIKYAKIYPWHGSVLKRRSSFAAIRQKKTPTLILWAQHRKPPPKVV